MKLWKLDHAKTETIGYDCNIGFVIAAKDENQARAIADAEAADEGKGFWIDAARSSCTEIVRGNLKPGIVLESFNAG